MPTVSVAAVVSPLSIVQKPYGKAEDVTSIYHSCYSLDVIFVDCLCLSVRSGLVVHSLEQINRDALRRCSSGLKADRDRGLTRASHQPVHQTNHLALDPVVRGIDEIID